MDPKHVLMKLGLKYLRDAGGSTTIHREFLKNDRPLVEQIANVTVFENNDNFITIVLKK